MTTFINLISSKLLLELSAVFFLCGIIVAILQHVSHYILRRSDEPPVVRSWIPILGSILDYGREPYEFFSDCQKKYGDVFTFIMMGRKQTVCMGTTGTKFVLGATEHRMSAAKVYGDLLTPTFGKDVLYDASPEKWREQKRFLKQSFTTEKLRSYVPIFLQEIYQYLNVNMPPSTQHGSFEVLGSMSTITSFTATLSLQGRSVRTHFNGELARLYEDLNKAFIPINFLVPGLPLPMNKKRGIAQAKIAAMYEDIIAKRRANKDLEDREEDTISVLMRSQYKDGTLVADHEVAHLLIGMMMSGQHTSSSIASWVLLRVASREDIQNQLYEEQLRVLGSCSRQPTYDDIQNMTLHKMVIKETLRLHAPTHSFMRALKQESVVTTEHSGVEKHYTIPAGRTVMCSAGASSRSEEYFPDPLKWEPYRWVDNLEDRSGPMSKSTSSAYLPFGAGRHRCIGEDFTYLQTAVIIATFIREFKISFPDNQFGAHLVPETDFNSMLTKPKGPVHLEWTRRTACGVNPLVLDI